MRVLTRSTAYRSIPARFNRELYYKGKPRLLSQGFLTNSVRSAGERLEQSLQRELLFIVPL